MIWHVARKEFIEITRDGRFLWTGAIIVVLLLAALGIGAQRYVEDRNLRTVAAAEVREQWLNQGEKTPHSAAHYGVYAFKPATPLALFDPGYNDYTGAIQYLEAHKENQAGFRPAADATAMQRFGNLSGAMVLQLLVPLLIILLCFGLISGEREDGTLRQLLSIGVPRRTLVWGKAIGAAIALGLVLIPGLLLGGVLAGTLTGVNEPHEMLQFPAKLLVLGLCYLMFFAVFVAVSIAVSITSRSSGGALTTLIGFWILAGLLIPRIGADVSKAVYKTPSAFQVAAAIDKDRDKGVHVHEPHHPNYLAFRDRTLKKYGVERVEDLPVSFYGIALKEDEEWGYKVADHHYGSIRRLFEKQDRVHQLFSLLSPFLAIKKLSAGLSGTDVAFANDFSQAAEGYRRKMMSIINDDVIANDTGTSIYASELGYRSDKSLWEKVPPLEVDMPTLATILQRNTVSLLVLLGWLIGSFTLLNLLAKRAKVDVEDRHVRWVARRAAVAGIKGAG
jgi:ABC-2 type transport system permease protein